MGFELRAQESYRVAEFHFPKSVKEVIKTESEINRVTGEKNTFKNVTYFLKTNVYKNGLPVKTLCQSEI